MWYGSFFREHGHDWSSVPRRIRGKVSQEVSLDVPTYSSVKWNTILCKGMESGNRSRAVPAGCVPWCCAVRAPKGINCRNVLADTLRREQHRSSVGDEHTRGFGLSTCHTVVAAVVTTVLGLGRFGILLPT